MYLLPFLKKKKVKIAKKEQPCIYMYLLPFPMDIKKNKNTKKEQPCK